jgi:hypothetical protein
MSRDVYQLDVARHGGAHVDRYSKNRTLVGRYQLDKTPIKHKGNFSSGCAEGGLPEV